jgi:hypothetical protein
MTVYSCRKCGRYVDGSQQQGLLGIMSVGCGQTPCPLKSMMKQDTKRGVALSLVLMAGAMAFFFIAAANKPDRASDGRVPVATMPAAAPWNAPHRTDLVCPPGRMRYSDGICR